MLNIIANNPNAKAIGNSPANCAMTNRISAGEQDKTGWTCSPTSHPLTHRHVQAMHIYRVQGDKQPPCPYTDRPYMQFIFSHNHITDQSWHLSASCGEFVRLYALAP
jgi:hypothetical protein